MYCSNKGLVAPKADKVLSGISVSVLQQLAESQQLYFVNRDISPEEFCAADEVFLCSTSPCLLPVTSINGQKVGDGTPGKVFAQLLAAWSDRVGLQIADQATKFSNR